MSTDTTMRTDIITISSISTGEIKLRVPQCNVRPDGSIWHLDRMPLIVTGGLPDHEALKAKYIKLVEAKRFDEIDPEHFARLGEIRDFRVEWESDFLKRPPHPVQIEKDRTAEDEAANRITIYLSSRGWGDFSPVEWTGDRRTPTAEIVAESRRLLSTGNDVDLPDRAEAELAVIVEEAKRASLKRDNERRAFGAELESTVVPADAVAAYRACKGDPEDFEDDIDDPRYWLVTRYAAAIEHQGL